METLQIEKANAVKAYKSADNKGKELLENLFGKSKLSLKITERIQHFADVLNIAGKSFDTYSGDESQDEYAYRQLKLIAEVLNGGWIPDWNNLNEYKYYPYFNMKSSFSLRGVCDCYSNSYVPSRLCFKSEELALFAAKTFLDIYKTYYTIN
jgi:hypothetical protein